MVKPDRIIQDLLDADPTKPLPSCLRWRVQCRLACHHPGGSDELKKILRGRWHEELSQQLDGITGDGDLSNALQDRLKLGDEWALKLAMGETTASSPMSPSLRAQNAGGTDWDASVSGWEEDLTNAMLARDGFPAHVGHRSRLRVAARNYARRQA